MKKIFEDYVQELKKSFKSNWRVFLIGFFLTSPYLLLNSILGEKVICFGIGRYLKAERVEFLKTSPGVVFHKIQFENEKVSLKNANVFFQWKFSWNYDQLKIGECSLSNADIFIKKEQIKNDHLVDERPSLLFKWQHWIPPIEIKKFSLKDISVSNEETIYQVSGFEIEELKFSFLSNKGSELSQSSSLKLAPKNYLKNMTENSEVDAILAVFSNFQSYLDKIFSYQKYLNFSFKKINCDARKIEKKSIFDVYKLNIEHFDITPLHLVCRKIAFQLNDRCFEGKGQIIFDKVSPFQFQWKIFNRNSAKESQEEFGSIIIQGNERLNTGFKIGGILKEELFQNAFFRNAGLYFSDVRFCIQAISNLDIRLHVNLNDLEENHTILLKFLGTRTEKTPWNVNGVFTSSAPFTLNLKCLPYRALHHSQIQIDPHMKFSYFSPEDENSRLGKLVFFGDLACLSGNIDMNAMNFSKSLPTFIEEEIILESSLSKNDIKKDLEVFEQKSKKNKNNWLLPAISFEKMRLSIAPELKIFCSGLSAYLEGAIVLNNSLDKQNLEFQGEILGKPLNENALINTIPIKLKEARLKASEQGIDHVVLEVWFDALSNARGKQLPFESFLILCSSSSFKVLARKRNSISFVDLFYLDWHNSAQLPMTDPSKNLLPFLSIVFLGSLGDFIRGIVPLERAERMIEELLSQVVAQPNVQLVQPCMKELNQLLLQLIIIDWNNWVNFWMGMNFPLSGMLEEKNVFNDGSKNQLQMVLDIFFNPGFFFSLEMLPTFKASCSFQKDLNEVF